MLIAHSSVQAKFRGVRKTSLAFQISSRSKFQIVYHFTFRISKHSQNLKLPFSAFCEIREISRESKKMYVRIDAKNAEFEVRTAQGNLAKFAEKS
jgi:hypothetical protein